FRVDDAVIGTGTRFLRVVMLGVPASALLFVMISSLRGAGDTRTPLAIGAVVGTVNVVLAYGLIFGRLGLPPLGVTGAALAIGVRILSLSFLPGFGFAAAAATMIGQSLGARRPDDAERSGRAAVRLAVWLMTAAGVLIFAAARPIARLFVDDAAVVADTVSFIRLLAACQPLMALDFTLGGALRGAGDTRSPPVAVFLGFYVCRLGFAWLVTFALGLGVGWLWLALVGDYLARSVLKGARFRSGVWKTVAV